jgi:hypothetical protein
VNCRAEQRPDRSLLTAVYRLHSTSGSVFAIYLGEEEQRSRVLTS